jgi:hypothetical protein
MPKKAMRPRAAGGSGTPISAVRPIRAQRRENARSDGRSENTEYEDHEEAFDLFGKIRHGGMKVVDRDPQRTAWLRRLNTATKP